MGKKIKISIKVKKALQYIFLNLFKKIIGFSIKIIKSILFILEKICKFYNNEYKEYFQNNKKKIYF
jgi:hypothetical protein